MNSGQMLAHYSRCLWCLRLDPATKKPAGSQTPLYHFHRARVSMASQATLSVARDKMVFTLGELTGNIWMAKLESRRKPMKRALVLLFVLPLLLAAADVSGKWVLDVTLSAGSGSPTFTFQQRGENLTGKYSGTLGEADVTGTVKGDAIQFQFTVKGDLGELTARYTGKVTGDAMKGKADYGSAIGDGTFEGKRRK